MAWCQPELGHQCACRWPGTISSHSAHYQVRHIMECHYKVVQYDMIWNTSTSLQWLSINQSVHPRNTSHISPWQVSYGMYFIRIWKKIDCVIMALHCISYQTYAGCSDLIQAQNCPNSYVYRFVHDNQPLYQYCVLHIVLITDMHSHTLCMIW